MRMDRDNSAYYYSPHLLKMVERGYDSSLHMYVTNKEMHVIVFYSIVEISS